MTTIADVTTAQRCLGTPTLAVVDNRGLVVRTVQYNRTAAEDLLEELISQQTYSVLGHLSSSIDPRLLAEQQLNSSVPPNFRYASSLPGQQLKVQSQDAGERLALYDSEGGVIWQQDARNQQLTRTFDTLHRLTSVTELAESTSRVSERLIYADHSASTDANLRGQLLQAYSPAGLTLTDSYSITGQLQRSQQRFLQDEVLRSDWAGSDSSAWNAALTPETFVTRWTYGALAQALQTLDAKGNQQRQRFNIAGQLTASELLLAGQTTPKAVLQSIDYSAAGQVLHEEAGNGVVTDYVYEAQTQRLSTLTTTRSAQSGRSTLLQALTYQYDPVGNLLAINDDAKAIRYTRNQRVAPVSQYQYDALYQLCQASGRENADAGQQNQALPPAIVPLWQESGELTNYTRTYTYDRGNNLTAIRHVGLHPYTLQMVVASTSNRAVQQTVGLTPQDVDGFFDACGNLQQLTAGQPLSWDSRNQLLRSTQVVRSGPDDNSEVYWYDSQGQRATKLGTALTSGTTRTQRVRYLPGLELRQTEQTPSEGGGTSVTEALQVIQFAAAGRQALRVLHWEQGKPVEIENNQFRYSLDDQIGSSLLEVDQQADILTWEEYFPFGGTAVWSARNETETQYKFVRYSGKERDATGLYYYGFRYYAPWLGRWLNPDPAGTVDGLNLFCMVTNNPVTRRDILGLGPLDWVRAQLQNGYQRLASQSTTGSAASEQFQPRTYMASDAAETQEYNFDPTLDQFNLDLHRAEYSVAGVAITGTNEERQQSLRQHVTSELAFDIFSTMANQAIFADPLVGLQMSSGGTYYTGALEGDNQNGEQQGFERANASISTYAIKNISLEGITVEFENRMNILGFNGPEGQIPVPAGRSFEQVINIQAFLTTGVSKQEDASDEIAIFLEPINPASITIRESAIGSPPPSPYSDIPPSYNSSISPNNFVAFAWWSTAFFAFALAFSFFGFAWTINSRRAGV